MPISLYEACVPPFLTGLKTLSKILEKGRVHFAADESKILEARLIADMGDLIYQIQRVSDTSKALAVRLAKAEPVGMADTEKTFPELQSRIERTIAVLESIDAKVVDAAEETEVIIKTRAGETKFSGLDYVQKFAVPNFYFHMCMTYAILRKEGVDVGKNDYLGRN